MSKMLPTEKPAPVSVAMIARNEAHNLPRCLDSVTGWVSEIVVVINDCSDETEAIARQYGAAVIDQPWTNFRDQKNVALDHAKQPWILALDADEAVSPELKHELLAFIEKDPEEYAGAEFPRKVWLMGRWITHGDWYPDYSLRLFRNGKGRWGGGDVHEKLDLAGPCKRLSADLLHYSYRDLDDHMIRLLRYAKIFGAMRVKQGKPFSATDAFLRPLWRFIRCYVIKRGFLDGYAGYHVAMMTAVYTFLRYTSHYEQSLAAAAKEPHTTEPS